MDRPLLAFTLIELLVVIAIIVTLMALVLAGMGLLREKAEVVATKSRMQEVAQLAKQSAGGVDDLQDAILGRPLRFESLRTCIEQLIEQHGVDLQSDFDTLPPGLASIYDTRIGCNLVEKSNNAWVTRGWRTMKDDDEEGLARRRPVLDNVIVWRFLQDFTEKDPFDPLTDTPSYHLYGDSRHGRTFWWWHRSEPPSMGGGRRSCVVYHPQSGLHESLDATLEAMPDGKWRAADFLAAWPLLSETGDPEDPVQRAWPDSDWDQATPGIVPPVWEVPFGRPIIRRSDGELATGVWLKRRVDGEPRDLGDLGPLASLRLLQRLGVVSQASDYRQDRGTARTWNDRWGNPLIVASGLWITPRYGLDPAPAADASHGLDKEHDGDLKGGRDWLRRRAQEVYGASRAAYLAVGALGPVRDVHGEDNPIATILPSWETGDSLAWSESEEPAVLRAGWLQVRELADLARYSEDRLLDPPWEDAVKVERGRQLVLCSGLIEIR